MSTKFDLSNINSLLVNRLTLDDLGITTAKQTRLFAVNSNYRKPKKKLIINYSDGSEYSVKNFNEFYINDSLITISIKAHKIHIDKGITQHIDGGKITIKKHLVNSLVEIEYDTKGNKVIKETQIKR